MNQYDFNQAICNYIQNMKDYVMEEYEYRLKYYVMEEYEYRWYCE